MKKNVQVIGGIRLSLLIFLLLQFGRGIAQESAETSSSGHCPLPTEFTSEIVRAATSPITFEARISWDGRAHGATAVQLYIGGILQQSDTVTTPTIFYTGLKADTYYNIHVRPLCSGKNSGTSGYEFLTPPLCASAENVQVTGNTNSFTATWDYPYAANFQYKVYDYFAGRLVAQGTTTDHTITITGLFPNTDYRIVIQAFCDPGDPTASGYFETHFVTQCAMVSNVVATFIQRQTSPVMFVANVSWNGTYRGRYEFILTGDDLEIQGTVGSVTSLTFDSLKSDTQYSIQLRTLCNGAPSDWVTDTFRTPIAYCNVSSPPGNTYIHQVSLNTIDNTSYGSYNSYDQTYGYGNYTHLSTTLTEDATYALHITAGGDAGVLRYFAAWIDYNRDADFDDAGEKVGLVSSTSNTVDINFTVPYIDAVQTAIRVEVKDNSSGTETEPAPCGLINAAEIEDYTVFIDTSPGNAGARQITLAKQGNTSESVDETHVAVHPNPVRDILTITGSIDPNTELVVLNQAGQTVFKSSSSRLDVSSLTPGIYNVIVMQNGKRRFSRFVKH